MAYDLVAVFVAEEASMKVCHIITGLSVGGAEMMLLKLLQHRERADLQSEVITLMPAGPTGHEIATLGVPVHALNLRRGLPSPMDLMRVSRLVRERSPDVVQGWMYHGNLGAWWAWCAGGRQARLFWNIRHSINRLDEEKSITRLLIRGGARLSSSPHRILYNSATAAAQHEAIGYDASRCEVIPNGFDTERFKPRSDCRAIVRSRLGIPADAVVIGMAARLHPMKDYPNFLRAAKLHRREHSDTHFVLIGRGIDRSHPVFAGRIDERMHLVGEQKRVEEWMNAMDLFCIASAWGEGFPNVLGEAMACGVPCVSTDVGDARSIIGDTGRVVPIGDPRALADAWSDVMASDVRSLGASARRRIEERYRIADIVRRYEELYTRSCGPPRIRARSGEVAPSQA